MRFPRRGTPRSAPESDATTTRSRRGARLLALGVVGVLAAGITAYVALADDETSEAPAAAAIHVTGSTFVDLPAELTAAGRVAEPEPRRAERPPVVPGSPRRLVIPTLGVDSEVVPITAPGGVLTPPDDAQQVGWWSPGAEPGAATGSALVTGHTLSRGGAALQDLESLEPGDRMSVRTANGRIAYRVADVRIFSKGTVAAEAAELFSQTSPGRLVVVTCEDYDGSVYLSNVVVTATPIGRTSVAS